MPNIQNPQSKTRESSIELLRIICMLMVLLLHYNGHVLGDLDVFKESVTITRSICWNTLEAFCIVAVDVFVLISGYFSIKLTGKSLLKLYLQCFFMGCVGYVSYVFVSGEPLVWRTLCSRVFAFSHNYWWFVVSYVGLMLISPILNAGTSTLNKKQLAIVVLLFSIVDCYFGWFKGLDSFNDGYSMIHFCFLYVLARFCGLHISREQIIKYRWVFLGIYFLMTAIIVISHFHLLPFTKPGSYSYNNPVIIVSALSLLLFMRSFSFRNKVINRVAGSAFAAYLLQESCFVGHKWLYEHERNYFCAIDSLSETYLMVFVRAITFFVIAIIIDQLFKLLSNQILRLYDVLIIRLNKNFFSVK